MLVAEIYLIIITTLDMLNWDGIQFPMDKNTYLKPTDKAWLDLLTGKLLANALNNT